MRLPRLPFRLRGRRRSTVAAALADVTLPFSTTTWLPELAVEVPGSGGVVTLGFRDGSTLEVEPDSAEGLALRTVAAALVDRNPDT
jgi:hypothetical protein